MKKTIHSEQYIHLLRWLRRHRLAAGLSMRSLGTRMNVPHSWIEKTEQGERRLDLLEFVKLCTALECDPHEGLQLLKRTEQSASCDRHY